MVQGQQDSPLSGVFESVNFKTKLILFHGILKPTIANHEFMLVVVYQYYPFNMWNSWELCSSNNTLLTYGFLLSYMRNFIPYYLAWILYNELVLICLEMQARPQAKFTSSKWLVGLCRNFTTSMTVFSHCNLLHSISIQVLFGLMQRLLSMGNMRDECKNMCTIFCKCFHNIKHVFLHGC